MNSPRLTPAQKSCLIEVFTQGEFLCPPSYRAADALIKAGLVDVEERHFGQRCLRKNNATVEYVRGL